MRKLLSLKTWASVAFLGAVLLAAADYGGHLRSYNVIILTVESTRADRVRPDVWPNILAAAQKGTVYRQHRSSSAWTGTGIVSLLTGLSPYDHGLHTRDEALDAALDLPLERLSEQGWTVAGLQAFMRIETFRNLGLRRETGEEMIPWIERHARAGRPFVLWHHYLETHLPYAPPDELRPDWRALLPPDDPDAAQRVAQVMTQPAIPSGSVAFRPTDAPAIAALYEAQLRNFDRWFAEFWQFYQSSGLAENTLLILTSDHGEELLDRGHIGHASTHRDGHLHEELVHVPLIVWWPEAMKDAPRGRLIDAWTDHRDIMPTVMQLLAGEEGQRLLHLPDGMQARPWTGLTSRAGFSEPDPVNLDLFIHGVGDGRWKLQWRKGQKEDRILLYDLSNDPAETRNLAAEHPAEVERLMAVLRPLAANKARAPRQSLDNAQRLPVPAWVRPSKSGAYDYDDLDQDFSLQWTGVENAAYIIQYQAGRGALEISGEIPAKGPRHDFGQVDKEYWDRWIKPYGLIRLRVRPANDPGGWSDWIELEPR